MVYFVSDPTFTTHLTGYGHPEQPARTAVIDAILEKEGLKTRKNTLKPRLAKEQEIVLCHTHPYFELVRREVEALDDSLETSTLSTGDTIISGKSFEVALLAAGGVLTGIDQIMTSVDSKVFCVTRPPGHHACSARGMGFCLFNNIAIGARYAQQKYGVRNVLIADWDVHHGNGTQELFYRDPTVFYFSTHEKDLYPYTGFAEELGDGPGEGFNLNCPIKAGASSRKEVIEAFEIQLKEAMKTFRPGLVLLSAGFDAHEDDPLGHFNLTNQDFYSLTSITKEIADEYAQGRLISVLEGGYDLQALAMAALAHTKALM